MTCCPNAFDGRHDATHVPTVEPSPAGGLRGTCKCGAQWRLTTAEEQRHRESEGLR